MVAVAGDEDGPPAAGRARVDGSRVGAAGHSELRSTALNCSQLAATAVPWPGAVSIQAGWGSGWTVA